MQKLTNIFARCVRKTCNQRTQKAVGFEIEMYALSDEQALLAKLRYNRLLDVFTGVTYRLVPQDEITPEDLHAYLASAPERP